MPMSPFEMIAFFEQQATMFTTAARKADESHHYQLALDDLSEAYYAHLMVGLLKWRQRSSDPSEDIGRTIDTAKESFVVRQGFGSISGLWHNNHAASAMLLKGLLDGEIEDTILRDGLPGMSQWGLCPLDSIGLVLDAALIWAVRNGLRPHGWDEVLNRIRPKKRLALLLDTYANYMTLIEESWLKTVDRILDTAHAGHRLFERRRRSSYFSGGRQTEGGGLDNSLVVDYRLAALLRWCPPSCIEILDQEAFPHLWRWSR